MSILWVLQTTLKASTFPFFILLASFALPFVCMKVAMARSNALWVSSAVETSISVSAGMVLAHWMLRTMPFCRTCTALGRSYDAAAVIGILTWELFDFFVHTMYPEHFSATPGVRTELLYTSRWSSYQYVARPISRVGFMELLYISSAYSAIEGFTAAVSTDLNGTRYSLTVLHQMMMALVLGITALRTRWHDYVLAMAGAFFAFCMSAALLFGTACSGLDIARNVYGIWCFFVCLISGAYGSTLFKYIFLPEVRSVTAICRSGMGVTFFLAVTYPVFDI